MSVRRYGRRLVERAPRELLASAGRVTAREASLVFDRAYVRWAAEPAARRAVRRAARACGGNPVCEAELRTGSPGLFFAGVSRGGAADPLDSLTRDRLQAAASALQAQRFDLLGTEFVLGDEMRWNVEPATGSSWPTGEHHAVFLRRLARRRGVGDIRKTWELNRFLHLPLLGRVYHLDRNANEWCARAFCSQVESWIASNPYGRGPNWSSTMDVSIRSINFTWGYRYFRDDPRISSRFWSRLLQSIWQHARHIERHPQSATIPDNHHVSHFLGLFYVGLLFPELPRAERWRDLGRAGLLEQMRSQVYDDGVQHECTTNYQKLVAEMFLHALVLAERNDVALPGWFGEQLVSMFEVLVHLAHPDGRTPTIGDTDNGRLQDVASVDGPNDYRPVLTAAAVALARPDLLPPEGPVPELAYALCDPERLDMLSRCAEHGGSATATSASFKQGGFFSTRLGSAHLIVRGGPFGLRGHGGHSHNDQLSFVYWYGRPVFVDSGMPGYAGLPAELIAYFRSTMAHNAVCMDDVEQLPLPRGHVERPRYSPHADRRLPRILEEPADSGSSWRLVLEHYYYQQLGVVHRRTFELGEHGGRLRLVDEVEGDGVHDLRWSFHLAAGLSATATSEGVAIGEGEALIGVLHIPALLRGDMDLLSAPRSHGYGRLSKGTTLRLRSIASLPVVMEFVFEASPLTTLASAGAGEG